MAKRNSKASGKSRTTLPDYIIREFLGTNTFIKDISALQDGETPDSLNWLTSKYKDNIQLRRGYALLGQTRNTGNGVITGLEVGARNDGKQVPFLTYGQKIKYYDSVADDTVEVSTSNIIPLVASSDYFSVMPYQNITGSYVYFTSPNSSIYKIPVANPATATDLLSSAFRGIANIQQNRMAMWQRKDNYKQSYNNVLYMGVSDKADISQYTQTTAEDTGSTGDGNTKNFTGTLAFNAANSKATCFNTEFAAPIAAGVLITGISKATQAVVTVASHSLVVGNAVMINGVSGMTQINNLIGIVMATTPTTITLSINSTTFTTWSANGTIYLSEYFIDDKNGALSSVSGGTGTINYGNGAFSITFNTAPLNGQKIFTQYYVEDSTSGGVADFTIDASTAGKGKTFPQMSGGGDIQGVFSFDQVQYCFHILKTWYLTLGSDDTKATDLPYRTDVGLPFFKAGYGTDDGIVYLDLSNPNNPKVQVLQIQANTNTATAAIVPYPLSEMLDLSTFGFSHAVMFRWGDYDLLSFAGNLNGIVQANNISTYARNRFTGQWDLLDYSVSSFAKYNGALLGGDSLSNNVYTLFSGFDDDGQIISNHWSSKQFDFGIEGLKKFNIFHIRGLIQLAQNKDISMSFDGGAFVKIATVNGNGAYVAKGTPQNIGSVTIGTDIIGGSSNATAFPYEVDIPFVSPRFEYVQVKFEATNIGFAQIDEFGFKDVRYKGRHINPINTITP